MRSQHKPLDFDRLVSLAVNKPEVLERLLRFSIYLLIAHAHSANQLTLKQLQFRIDAVRYRSKTPLAACIRISAMMQDNLIKLNQTAETLPSPPIETPSTRLNSRGKVIPIRREKRDN